MAGETIIVVDDAPVNLKLAAAVLRREGYKVYLACNAEESLMMLRTMVPDLLLVDIQLPWASRGCRPILCRPARWCWSVAAKICLGCLSRCRRALASS